MTELVITVYGEPAPQGSKWSPAAGRVVEVSRKIRPWRKAVAAAVLLARAGRHLEGPLEVEATFLLQRPKSHYGTGRNAAALRGDAPAYPIAKGKGDSDKFARGLLDALQFAGVYDDDGQVVTVVAHKFWAETGTVPGAVVTVRTVGR